MEKSNELKLDRSLLDKDFPGYKLMLTSIPVYQESIEEGVDVVGPNEDQYSFLHHREFGTHNHLYADPWNAEIVYFITTQWKLCRCRVNEIARLEKPIPVWEMPGLTSRLSGAYNPSLCFATEDMAVLSDGMGSLFVLNTSTRADLVPWKLIYRMYVPEMKTPFKLVDCRGRTESLTTTLHCLLLHIQPVTSQPRPNRKTPGFETVLKWLVLSKGDDDSWSQTELNELKGPGAVDYAALEPSCKGIYIVSDVAFKSDSTIEEVAPEESVHEFEWQQTFDEIKLWIPVPEGCSLSNISITTEKLNICVKLSDVPLLTGPLHSSIDPDLTTWSFNETKLEIIMQKEGDGGMWPKLIEGINGKELMDGSLVEEVHSKLAHLCSETVDNGSTVLNTEQFEECDAFDEESRNLMRFERGTLKLSHQVGLGSQQWLLTVRLLCDSAPAFCIRNDVDGVVYQPQEPDPLSAQWKVEHVGTYLAYGYIQASKTNKKFAASPSDLSYISIIDVTGHVILYRKGVSVSNSLRNRKTGQTVKELAVQNLINLHSNAPILGAQAFQQHLFVLTKDTLYALHIV